MIFGIFAWMFMCVLVGMFASQKNRSGTGYFFLSVIISPFLAVLFLLVVKEKLTDSDIIQQTQEYDAQKFEYDMVKDMFFEKYCNNRENELNSNFSNLYKTIANESKPNYSNIPVLKTAISLMK